MIRPPPPCLIICFGGDLRAEERALQVDREDLVVLRLGGVQHVVRVSTPALFTMMSSRPKVETAVSTRRWRSATLLTSASHADRLARRAPDLLLERLGRLGVAT